MIFNRHAQRAICTHLPVQLVATGFHCFVPPKLNGMFCRHSSFSFLLYALFIPSMPPRAAYPPSALTLPSAAFLSAALPHAAICCLPLCCSPPRCNLLPSSLLLSLTLPSAAFLCAALLHAAICCLSLCCSPPRCHLLPSSLLLSPPAMAPCCLWSPTRPSSGMTSTLRQLLTWIRRSRPSCCLYPINCESLWLTSMAPCALLFKWTW